MGFHLTNQGEIRAQSLELRSFVHRKTAHEPWWPILLCGDSNVPAYNAAETFERLREQERELDMHHLHPEQPPPPLCRMYTDFHQVLEAACPAGCVTDLLLDEKAAAGPQPVYRPGTLKIYYDIDSGEERATTIFPALHPKRLCSSRKSILVPVSVDGTWMAPPQRPPQRVHDSGAEKKLANEFELCHVRSAVNHFDTNDDSPYLHLSDHFAVESTLRVVSTSAIT